MNGHWDRDALGSSLRRALPYIRLFKNKTFVIKVGGALCGEPAALAEVVEQVAVLRELGIRVVLVHGGGPQTTALSQKLGLETKFVQGRRVTDEKTLEVAVMTIAGTVNTALLSACRAAELPAVGLSGVDASLVVARRRPPEPVDYGLVGDIVAVDPAVLHKLLDGGFVPVVSPLCADEAGQVLNVNADTVASRLAQSLGADKVLFVGDTSGLLEDKADPASLVSYTDVAGLRALREKGALDAGMLPKARAAEEALLGGVKRVHLVGYKARHSLLVEVFTNEGSGTLIVREAADLSPTEQSASAAPRAVGA
ncbi:MAG: acetylglutamate kinase [Myxococcales bacterium]